MKTWADGWLLPDRQAYPQNGLLSITGRRRFISASHASGGIAAR